MRREFFNHRERRGHKEGTEEVSSLKSMSSSVISVLSAVNISGVP